MNRSTRAAAVLVLPMLAGCPPAPGPTPIAGPEPGWNCLAYPSAFRDAGVVYALSTRDRSATTFKDFHGTPGVTINVAQAADVSTTRRNTVSAGVLASLLGLSLKASADAATKYTVTQTFSGALRSDVDSASDYKLRDAFYASPELQQAIRYGDAKDHEYFLIRNTIRARAVSYSFDRDITANIDVSVPIHGVTGEVKAGLENSSGLKYAKTFARPQDVCLYAEALPIPRQAATPALGLAPRATLAAPGGQAGDAPPFASYTP